MDLSQILNAVFVVGLGAVFAATMSTALSSILTAQNISGGLWDVVDTILEMTPVFGGLLALYGMFYFAR